MNINEKDKLLDDWFEGRLDKAELLRLHPELETDIELIVLSQSALSELEPIAMRNASGLLTIKPKRTRYKIGWYVAASFFLAGGIFLCVIYFSAPSGMLSDNIKSKKLDEQLIGCWSLLQSENKTANYQDELFNLATTSLNSNIRYLALQKIISNPLKIPESELNYYLTKETHPTNQTPWIDLWIKLYGGTPTRLIEWLNQPGINPVVKEYGLSEIESLAAL